MIAKDINEVVRKGDLTKIENYNKAVADTTQIWECHHRLELTLDGEFAHSQKELERMGMYYHRPYFELIFLTPAEHRRLHIKGRSEETKRKSTKANKGQKRNEAFRKRISKALKGRKLSDEHKKNLSKAMKNKAPFKGKPISEETKKKKSVPKSDFGRIYFEHYGYSKRENPKQYNKELSWYHKHNKSSWE